MLTRPEGTRLSMTNCYLASLPLFSAPARSRSQDDGSFYTPQLLHETSVLHSEIEARGFAIISIIVSTQSRIGAYYTCALNCHALLFYSCLWP